MILTFRGANLPAFGKLTTGIRTKFKCTLCGKSELSIPDLIKTVANRRSRSFVSRAVISRISVFFVTGIYFRQMVVPCFI